MPATEAIKHVHATPEDLAVAAASWLCALASASSGRFAVSLSGGSTPKRLYELLASEPLRGRLPWERVHWFWGDERYVPADSPDSNYRMTRLAMLERASVPAANVHPVRTDLPTPEATAAAYAEELQRYYGARELDPQRPLFDVTLLGMGEDGHTASLFPGTQVLGERKAWAAAVIGAKPEPRITLTYPVLESSRDVAFLIAGAGKRDVLAAIRKGADLPAGRLKPQGRLHWFLDRAADGAAG